MFILSGLVLILFPIFANIGDELGFWLVFFDLFFFSIVSGICRASIYALCGDLPHRYMGAVMFGTGISGIVSNLLRALSLIIWPISDKPGNAYTGVLVYSLIAAIMLFVCGIGQFMLAKNEFAVYHLWQYPGFFKPEYQALKMQATESSIQSRPKLLQKPTLVEEEQTLQNVLTAVRENFANTQGLLYSCVFIFLITLLLFPGVTNDSSFNFLANSPNA